MRRTQFLLCAALFALALAACGGANGGQDATPAADAALPTAGALASVTPEGSATAAPAATPVADASPVTGGASLSGQALWGDEPVVGALIELRAPDWRASGDENAAARATTDETGSYSFTDVTPGEYSVVAIWPTGEISAGGTPVVTLAPGAAAADTRLQLERTITLLEPRPGEPVGQSPAIRWQPVEGITTYRVMVIDKGTSAAVVEENVDGDSLTVAEPLETGRDYTLVVSGMGPAGEPLANATLDFSASGTDDGATTDGLPLPEACYMEGQTIFADPDLGLCFALPLDFALSANGGGTQIAGPPLGPGPEPLMATLDIERRPAEGKDVATLVDDYLAELPATGTEVQRTEVTLGGDPAIILEPVPGRLASRQIAVVHGPGDFYILSVGPTFRDTAEDQWTDEMRQAQAQADELFETATLSFAFLPPPGVPSVGAIPVPTACAGGRTFYLNLSGGYCFAVPAGFVAQASGAGAVEVLGPARDEQDPPLRALMTMETPAPVENQTLPEVVDAYAATMDDAAISQSDVTLGGEPAIRLDNLPGDNNWRDLFVLRDGTAFHFLFGPDPAAFPAAETDAQTLFDALQSSFTFLEMGD